MFLYCIALEKWREERNFVYRWEDSQMDWSSHLSTVSLLCVFHSSHSCHHCQVSIDSGTYRSTYVPLSAAWIIRILWDTWGRMWWGWRQLLRLVGYPLHGCLSWVWEGDTEKEDKIVMRRGMMRERMRMIKRDGAKEDEERKLWEDEERKLWEDRYEGSTQDSDPIPPGDSNSLHKCSKKMRNAIIK